MNYIKRFQNARALSVSVENNYSEDQLLHKFLDNFHRGGKYAARIASNQVELRREENSTDEKYLTISFLQTDDLNIVISSGFGRNSERAKRFQTNWTFCGGANNSAEKCFKRITKGK